MYQQKGLFIRLDISANLLSKLIRIAKCIQVVILDLECETEGLSPCLEDRRLVGRGAVPHDPRAGRRAAMASRTTRAASGSRPEVGSSSMMTSWSSISSLARADAQAPVAGGGRPHHAPEGGQGLLQARLTGS